MSEDLRKLSWFEIARRVEELTAQCESNEDTIERQSREIGRLRVELRAAQDSLAKIEAPVFEVGKCYRNERGEIRGPLFAIDQGEYRLSDSKFSYTSRGIFSVSNPTTDKNLLPGAVEPVPTWTPPSSLPDGEYVAVEGDGLRMPNGDGWLNTRSMLRWFEGYIQPTDGRWRVENGTATWLGES